MTDIRPIPRTRGATRVDRYQTTKRRAPGSREWLDDDVVRSFLKSPVAMVSAFVAAILTLFGAFFAPWIAPYNPFDLATLDLMEGFSRPMVPNEITGRTFWLGTDNQGRDVFSAILYGMRISLYSSASLPCCSRWSSASRLACWLAGAAAGSMPSSCASPMCSCRFRRS